jgi:hypothetical protein
MHKPGQRCTPLLEKTADALSGSIVALMLSVQKDNLELNVNRALKWYVPLYHETRMRGVNSHHRAHASFVRGSGSIESVINICVSSFPSTWVSYNMRVLSCLLLKEDCYLVLGQSILAYSVMKPIMC